MLQGKDQWFHDGHLRYGAAQPLIEGTCGLPMWTVISPESQVPDRALVAAHDTRICDGTACGKVPWFTSMNEHLVGLELTLKT
jgi:hypothetical protein